MKNTIIALHTLWMVAWTAFWISEGPASFTFLEYLIVIFPYAVSLPTLYYLKDLQPKEAKETKEAQEAQEAQEDTHE